MNVCRYFTGHTTDTNGNVQFKAGTTKVGDAVDGAIKILTVAVCFLFFLHLFYSLVVVWVCVCVRPKSILVYDLC